MAEITTTVRRVSARNVLLRAMAARSAKQLGPRKIRDGFVLESVATLPATGFS